MRYISVSIVAAFALTGCAGQNPLRPDAASTLTIGGGAVPGSPRAAAAADASTSLLRFSVDLTVPAYPACPLSPPGLGPLVGDGVLTIVVRTTTNTQGTHFSTTIFGHGKLTDPNGDRWVWSDADLNNELIPGTGNTSSNSFSQTATEGFHVIGPMGQHIMVKGTFHITKVDGTTVVEFEKGNHEANEFCESGFVLTPL